MQCLLWMIEMLHHLQHGDHVKRLRRKGETLRVHSKDSQALDAAFADGTEVRGPPLARIHSRDGQVRKCGQQWPEKRSTAAADIEKTFRSDASQDAEHALHTR